MIYLNKEMDTTNDNNRSSQSDGSANLKRNGQLQNAKYNPEETGENRDDQFPGYPHYPANEDITKQMERVPVDVENLAPSGPVTNQAKKPEAESSLPQESSDDE